MDMLRGGWGPGLLGNGMGAAASVSYDAATEAIAAAFTTPPTTGRKNLIDAAVVSLKSAGVWTKLDVLYAFAAADSQAAKVNWKAPGTFNCTEVNAPAFAADLGFTGASTKYLDAGFNPTTATTPQYALNSATIFAWSLTNADNAFLFGQPSGGPPEALILALQFGTVWPTVINSTTIANVSNTNGSGHFLLTRRGASSVEAYRNTTSLGTPTDTSTSVQNGNFNFHRRGASYSAHQIAVGGFGSQLSAADNTALYNALRTYLTGVGVP
jgi:hypothetical protein